MPPAHSRRDFFRLGVRRVAGGVGQLFDAVSRPAARGPAAVRPPGAVPEAEFLAACTRCDDCIPACPKDAIRKAGPETGVAAGTPIILPQERACHWCADFPCITACTAGALVRTGAAPALLGTARIAASACYAWQGQPCEYCLPRCPVPGAIATDPQKRPVIDEGACVGCGVCADPCPAEAITLLPARPLPGVAARLRAA